MHNLYIGTCSWKYPSWKGLVYSSAKPDNFLLEYSSMYNSVEVDQWFWSLFGDSVVLPKKEVVHGYAKSVSERFLFGIKVPNSITLTHHYKKKKTDSLIENPHFLSVDLMHRFLDTIQPLHSKLGPLMFQFEYLNKKKMRSQNEFQDRLAGFIESLPKEFCYAIEIRNPNYFNERYFTFLEAVGISHVFLQGYYMPSIFSVYSKCKSLLTDSVVIRLHGPNRADIEKETGKKWGDVVYPRDDDLRKLIIMLKALESNVFLYVNNHFEGSAPRTIQRIEALLS